MRLVLELLVVAGLVALGWNKSFSERAGMSSAPIASSAAAARPIPAGARENASGAAATTSSPSGAWMWDRNRRATLDRPAYDPKESHPWQTDESGRRYWLDGQGKRHYER